MPLLFFDRVEHECLDQSKGLIEAAIREHGVESRWSDQLPEAGISDDVIVLGHSGSQPRYPIGHVCFMGKRLLNRRQRLVLAEQVGAPVARWAAPEDGRFEPLLARLETGQLLYKSDASFRRRGVHLVRSGDTVDFKPAGDIYMEVLDGDPCTYKMAVFYDTVIACRRLETRSVFDPEFHTALSMQYLVDYDAELWALGSLLGRTFAGYSGGYMSIDFMRCRGRWFVIEINPCGVGRRTSWRLWPEVYAQGYTRGVLKWLADDKPEPLDAMRARARALADVRAGGIAYVH